MDFSNEHYVRIYTRDTTTWKLLGFAGQTVFMHVARKLDAAGVLDTEGLEPWEAVVLHCGVPEELAREGVAKCLRYGVLTDAENALVAPRYVDAQRSSKSDKQRQKEHRETRRLEVLGRVTKPDKESRSVTVGHDEQQNDTAPSRSVTQESRSHAASHSASHAVTLTNADPMQCGAGPVTGERASAPPPPPSEAQEGGPEPEELEDLEPYAGPPKLRRGDVASAWRVASAGQSFPGDPKARAAFEAWAEALNRRVGADALLVCWAHMHWVFRAEDGPVRSGRVPRPRPWTIQPGILEDLETARKWWESLAEGDRAPMRPPANGAIPLERSA